MSDIMSGNKNKHKGVKYNRIVDAEAGASPKATAFPSRYSFSFLQTLPKWMLLLIACPVFILGVALFTTQKPVVVKHEPATGPQLAIPLHPEDHIYRGVKVLQFDWTITSGIAAPDGVERPVYLVNGEFPGPTIEGRSGDRIMVTVHNNLTNDEGVSIHWHGLQMGYYNEMDGAVGFTQCPIAPGSKFLYSFLIGDQEEGTFWWHSHSGVQRGDGLYGGLVIHKHGDPDALKNQYLLMVGDWFHRKQSDILEWFADAISQGHEPVPDSMLVNGRGHFDCKKAKKPINCTDTKTKDVIPLFNERRNARLRVVNVGTVAGVSVAVDGAKMQPLEVDGASPVRAEAGDAVGVLYPGERVDINMTWVDETIKQPRLGLYLDDENFSYVNDNLKASQSFAAIPETLESWNVSDKATPLNKTGLQIDLTSLTSSTEIPDEIKDSQQTVLFYVRTMIESHFANKPLGHFNHTTWTPQSEPLLSLNRSSWDKNQLLPYIESDPDKPTVVTLVINNRDDGAHPMHLHGHSFYVLSTHRADGRAGAWGSYNPFDPEESPPEGLNLKNPVRRDTVAIPRRGHVIIRFIADNPGLWMLHCHMLVHKGTGMVAGLHVGSGDEPHVKDIDAKSLAMCKK